jgi:hypothetical protein
MIVVRTDVTIERLVCRFTVRSPRFVSELKFEMLFVVGIRAEEYRLTHSG